MYCNACGKPYPKEGTFCKYCGAKIVREAPSESVATLAPVTQNITGAEVAGSSAKKSGINSPIDAWLGLVALGLIGSTLVDGYSLLKYPSLLSNSYAISGYSSALWLEFIGIAAITAANAYVFYLFYKRKKDFPKYYLILIGSTVIYNLIDYTMVSSLTSTVRELQQAINTSASQVFSSLSRSIFSAMIWGSYIVWSKKVKTFFIND